MKRQNGVVAFNHLFNIIILITSMKLVDFYWILIDFPNFFP